MASGDRKLVLVEKLALDIRPELFDYLGNRVGAHLFQQLHGVVIGVPGVRMVGIPNSSRRRVPNPFREIELESTPVFLGDDHTTQRVAGAAPLAAGCFPEIARILVK